MIFSEKQADFILKELGIDVRNVELTEDLLCEIQDEAFDIECFEANRSDEPTERGELAAGIVTLLGDSPAEK